MYVCVLYLTLQLYVCARSMTKICVLHLSLYVTRTWVFLIPDYSIAVFGLFVVVWLTLLGCCSQFPHAFWVFLFCTFRVVRLALVVRFLMHVFCFLSLFLTGICIIFLCFVYPYS